MNLQTMYTRAKRGLREDARLYVIAVSSLTIAFLCLGLMLLGALNLDSVAERWGRTHRMSVYLKPNASAEDVQRLTMVLSALDGIDRVEHLTPQAARDAFLTDAQLTSDLSGLPLEAFPASIEVEFAVDAGEERIQDVATKVGAFGAAVQEVDTYRSWFDRLAALMSAGRAAVAALAGLVFLCVFAVVANTIRLAVASRRDEIEMLKMCGATDSFVRGPFVVEGALQGLVASTCALFLLALAFLALRGQVDATLGPLAGIRLSFLSPMSMLGLALCGAVAGALGSAVSIRRYMSV